MNIGQIAMQLWPCWMLGIIMVYLTWSSQYRNVLRIEPKAILKFCGVLAMIAAGRFLMLKFLASDAELDSLRNVSNMIPWQAILGVFWEDACHSMPLVLLGMMFDKEKWYKWGSGVLLAAVMLSFASGHVYQGIYPALAISFYIPVAMKYGRKFGFGTVMICHTLYDMSTLLLFKWMLG